ncbi:MAG TPA: type I glyceraldehyde-3-phosphate dehydrogenase, partial [Kiloniellales bacterium]
MAVRVAINGFGRIGRLVLWAALESKRQDITFVAINDLGSAAANAHLLKYDSVHGRFPGKIEATKSAIKVDGSSIQVLAERDPAKLPWGKLGIDVVLECTGLFTNKEAAAKHLAAGAKKVLVSAPCTDADLTVVYGVNHDKLRKRHTVVSNASCTTNCLVPVAYVLDQAVGIKHGFMTTVHSFTGDQRTVDTLHKDLRRARAAS